MCTTTNWQGPLWKRQVCYNRRTSTERTHYSCLCLIQVLPEQADWNCIKAWPGCRDTARHLQFIQPTVGNTLESWALGQFPDVLLVANSNRSVRAHNLQSISHEPFSPLLHCLYVLFLCQFLLLLFFVIMNVCSSCFLDFYIAWKIISLFPESPI